MSTWVTGRVARPSRTWCEGWCHATTPVSTRCSRSPTTGSTKLVSIETRSSTRFITRAIEVALVKMGEEDATDVSAATWDYCKQPAAS